jgi:GNAT superfamily N-acetyltransferase
MTDTIRIDYLAAHPEALPEIRRWLETEWASYYGASGPGDAEQDVKAYANRGSLPVGIVAFQDGRLCGIGALKADSIASHAHLSPWAAAGLVDPSMRGKGIGARLLAALEQEGRTLGFDCIYCGTSTASSLLERCGWELMERIVHDGNELGIYRKAL